MISVFDLFSIGIGPSSSHTVGPMLAARQFADWLIKHSLFNAQTELSIELFGSLGATGRGHGTGKAIILGLLGEHPEQVDCDQIERMLADVDTKQLLCLAGQQNIAFPRRGGVTFHRRKSHPGHNNAMTFHARFVDGTSIDKTYYSLGGGFIADADESFPPEALQDPINEPFAFKSGQALLQHCEQQGLSIAAVVMANEQQVHSTEAIDDYCERLWQVMNHCIERGMQNEGILPGGLKLKRRAPILHQQLQAIDKLSGDPLNVLDWVNLFALSVSEENAAGGRVVTAPTNGAAGIIPATLAYFNRFIMPLTRQHCRSYFLTATAIGSLYKQNASISGAEVGCQGEVGVAASMAAAGLAAILGATPEQVENAAEIAIEHNLGLTCDPVGGLVQVPCIERNAMGAIKALNACRLALRGTGLHTISLDKAIRTMWQTGKDMKTKYKETARGGLAVNIIEC
ncbi:L-serine ammonia-lyase [Celerinatantimonas yamalensis]|uniref:L-serine dehydratase n=1 Tax=Celerinatantimonas yamalensis TaxID=559956 RepID=A0ABW9G3C9_9GAMM